MKLEEKIDKYLNEASSKEKIDDYADKFERKMNGSTYSTAAGWVDGIGGLSNKEKKQLLKKIKKFTEQDKGDLPSWAK